MSITLTVYYHIKGKKIIVARKTHTDKNAWHTKVNSLFNFCISKHIQYQRFGHTFLFSLMWKGNVFVNYIDYTLIVNRMHCLQMLICRLALDDLSGLLFCEL